MFAGHVIGVDPVTEPMLDRDGFALLAFEELVAGGSILDSPRTMGEVLDRFREAGGRGALPDGNFLAGGNREEIYTEMYAGLITPRSIGANLFTGAQYEGYQQNEGERELTLWVASEGSFSLVSNIHFQAENEYLFDRVKLVQGDLKVRLTKDFHRRLGHGPEAGRSRGTAVLFRLPPDAGLDPLAPFDVVLMIAGKDADGSPMTIEVPMAYQLPERHMLPPPPVPLWVQTWREKQVDIAILGLLLVAVTIIFLFQDFLDPLSPDLHPGPGCNPCLRSGLVGLVRGGPAFHRQHIGLHPVAIWRHRNWCFCAGSPDLHPVGVCGRYVVRFGAGACSVAGCARSAPPRNC